MNNVELRAKTKAEETRRILGYGDEPIHDIFATIESEGILLIKAPAGRDGLSAFFVRKREEFIIFINTSKSLGHQYFSAAHELYHYMFDKDVAGGICNTALFDESQLEREKLADYFAVHFLMPETSIRRHVYKIKSDSKLELFDIIKLQHYFKVSYLSMIIRLNNLGLIDRDEFLHLKNKRVTSVSRNMGYKTDLALPTSDTYISPDYVQLALDAYQKGKITYTKFEEYLDVVGLDASKLLSIDGGEVEGDVDETSSSH